ncbi:Ribonuclease D [Alphaproteobacteria bacterium SO-S41]|nr:Ribonuclease D [Alphaproteobacteria bacterium SO-S41]
MELITTTEGLAQAVDEASSGPFVTVDTEFMRESTYWPILCLIQFASAKQGYLVDPMAPGIDLNPFFALLDRPDIVKVFHAARQDVEIFHHLSGRTPTNLFDTQVAGMVCGLGESISYENLIRETTGHAVDKSSRFTDWSRRPLSEKQLVYALGDVTHLRDAYRVLSERIAKQGRASWIEEEMAILTDPSIYAVDPEEAWRRLKVRSGSKKMLAALKGLAAWREREAQTRDVPRQRILKDDALLDIASHAPKTVADLDGLRSVPRGYAQSRNGAAVLEAIAAGLALPADQVPQIERSERLPEADSSLVDALKLLLKLKSDEAGVAARLIANSADMERLAAYAEPDVPAVHGWRREVFGAAAMDLKAGRLVLKIEDGRLKASAA